MNRLKGKLPKIGIRPTIDGRRKGVRESLEAQTMQMAEAVKKLIESTLKHISGEKVECVIADTTIGGAAEAALCEQKFKDENVCASITVTPCWCYGSETMDNTPNIPKAVWGYNGTERPGAVYLAAVGAAHSQFGDPVFSIYGKDVQNKDDKEIPADVKAKIILFAKAGIAVGTMRGKSYLSIGNTSMGIAGSIVDPYFFNDYLGMRTEWVDMSELKRRLELNIFDSVEFKKAMDWTEKNCKTRIGLETNVEKLRHDKKAKELEWEIVVKMTLIIKDLMVGNSNLAKMDFIEESNGHNAILAGFQGQRSWTDFMPNGDFSEAILNSQFDWNGIRQAYLLATENDALNGVAMLFNHLMTDTAQIFADVRTYWSNDAVKKAVGKELPKDIKDIGIIHLINSGSATLDGTGRAKDAKNKPTMKPFWELKENEVSDILNNVEWCPAEVEYFRGGGWSSRFTTKGAMPLTMSRVNLVKGLGPVLQIVEGYSVELEKEMHDILDLRTNPTWPTTWFVPKTTKDGVFKNAYEVMNAWGANHGAISYGHIGDKLITLASMLRIPVTMHNVDDQKIFRPKTWSLFGTKDLEAADFNACKNFGPIYGKLNK